MGAFDYSAPSAPGVRPAGLINGASAYTVLNIAGMGSLSAYAPVLGLKIVTTPAVTANVLTPILRLSGKGALSALVGNALDATVRTHRLKLTLDGNVIFDATATSGVATWQFAVGAIVPVTSATDTFLMCSLVEFPLLFEKSCLVEFASSLTETAKSQVGYRYYPR